MVHVDEATDAGNEEQLAISLRYVKPNPQLSKRSTLPSVSVWPVWVRRPLQTAFSSILLSATQLHVRGQTYMYMYDQAGAMEGKKKGMAACITQLFPKMLYIHCAAHVLNLCAVKCCPIPDIRNTMDSGNRSSTAGIRPWPYHKCCQHFVCMHRTEHENVWPCSWISINLEIHNYGSISWKMVLVALMLSPSSMDSTPVLPKLR